MKDLTDQYEIESRATSSWEHGNPIHRGTQKIFQQYQVPYDPAKVADLKQMAPAGTEHKIHLFAAESVPDPWYTGDFEETYSRVLTGCKAWLDQLATS